MNREQDMSRNCFGYGRWDAPYWFIGPEQGMSRTPGEQASRLQAWIDRDGPDLDDCRGFHRHLDSIRCPARNKYGKRIDDWHGTEGKPKAQPTWARLIHFLIGYDPHVKDFLAFQKEHWGSADGNTCVIELSGLAASSLAEKRDRLSHLPERMDKILGTLNGNQQFVLLYGNTASCRYAWQQLVQKSTQVNFCSRGEEVRRLGKTLLVRSRFHPTGNGQPYEAWKLLGQEVNAIQQAGQAA